jgi:hypothetical protein
VDPEVRVLQTFEFSRGKWIETGVFSEDDVVRAAPLDARRAGRGRLVGDATGADDDALDYCNEGFPMTDARQQLLDEFVRTGHEADAWRHWP